MANNVLFLVHGIGQHGEKWAEAEDGPITALEASVKQYPYFSGKKLSDLVDLVPIRYDDIFDRILETWADLAKGITENAGAISKQAITDTLTHLGKMGDDKNTFLRYGGDVILYRGFKLFAQRVQIRVITTIAEVITKKLKQPSPTPVRFSILAHSMGTAVIHDALHHLGTENWLSGGDSYAYQEDSEHVKAELQQVRTAAAGLTNPFGPDVFRFDTLFMLANTSALLHTTKPSPYESIVRPGTGGHQSSYVSSYCNIEHELDPVPKVGRFRMPDVWKQFGGGFDITDLDHIYEYNIHSFAHYLKHPKVHLRVLTALINAYEPSQGDLDRLSDFPKWGGQFKEPNVMLREKLRNILSENPDLNSVMSMIKAYQALRELKG